MLINGVDGILNIISLFQNITSMLKNFLVAQDVTILHHFAHYYSIDHITCYEAPLFRVKSFSYEMKINEKNINIIFQENMFENEGRQAMCMFVLPTMCEMGLWL